MLVSTYAKLDHDFVQTKKPVIGPHFARLQRQRGDAIP